MGRKRMMTRFWMALALASVAFSIKALPPSNDDWAQRIVVAALPFSNTLNNIAEATTADTDPRPFCRIGTPGQGVRSVWYSITPSVETFLNIEASGYDTMIAVYTGAAGAFAQVAGGCNDDGLPSFASRIVGLRLQVGVAYSIYVAQWDAATVPASLNFQLSAPSPYVVTQFADRAGASCTLGNCSLREAVSASNANPAAILLGAGTYTLSLAGASEDLNASGDLDIREGLALYGQGMGVTVISAAAANDRVLQLDPTAITSRGFTVLLRGLTLADGNAAGDGGGIGTSTALNTNDYLAMERVGLRNNRASGAGGGMRFNGYAEIEAAAIELNEANGNGGGLVLAGGANTRVEIDASTLADNLSRSAGGALHTASGTTTVVSSTISGNRANGAGGGVLAAITTAVGGLQLRYATVANNLADADNNDLSEGGGVYFQGSTVGTLIGNLMANNRLDGSVGPLNDCGIQVGAGVPATASNFVRAVGSCEFNSSGDIVNLDPKLAPLRANGGPTRTHLPAYGSAALDGLAAGCPSVDQRGVPRPLDGNADQDPDCDFGAVENDVLFADGYGDF